MSFIRLENEDITITADKIVSPAWGENTPTLTTFFTSSFQSSSESGPYFLDIYSEPQGPTGTTGSVQFSIAHAVSGSSFTTASHAVWNQYTTLLYGSDKAKAKTDLTENFYAINVSRVNYKERLEVSGFLLAYEGPQQVITTSVADPTSFEVVDGGRKFKLLDLEGSQNPGFLFPDVGIVILVFENNPNSDTDLLVGFNNGQDFTLFSEETITSNLIFTRVRNSQLNYSTNPSFVDSSGIIIKPQLVDSPQVFPTTVGLYNDSNELVAVAKLSRPLIKDFNKEALLRIKLDF